MMLHVLRLLAVATIWILKISLTKLYHKTYLLLKVGLHENNCKWSGAERSGVEASVAKLKQVEQSGAELKGCLHEIFYQVEQSGAERS